MLATPFKFGKSIRSSISLQNMEEEYTVLEIERNDIYRMDHAHDTYARLQDFKKMIQRAQDISEEGKHHHGE